ncbi:winged helix DNA-binding protein [Thermostilla marina]
MNTIPPANDLELLDLLRVEGPMDVTEMAQAVGVTATAIRQRLGRLMAEGAIRRRSVREGRGRPKHVYELTERGVRLTGSNFTDLAFALWEGVCAVDDPQTREAIIRAVAAKLAEKYAAEVAGTTPAQRMEALIHLLGQRRVPFRVDKEDGLPVLNAEVCPYPGLAETNRDICRLEKLMLSQLMGHEMDLAECRADGSDSCRFCLSPGSTADAAGESAP